MKRLMSLGLAVLVAALFGGCRQQGGLDPETINEAYAGLTTEDEEPQFGEPAVFGAMAASAADPVVDDTIAADPSYVTEEQKAPTIHYLLLAWGKLKRDSIDGTLDVANPQDFSGTLSVTAGGMVVVRKVRMEAVQGDGVLPRTDRKLLEWKSTIYGGVDGLLVKIAAPADATVTLTAAGQTIAKTVAELDLTYGIVDIPGTDDALAWAAAKVEKAGGCPHGYMVGRWNKRLAIGGVFRGRWVSADGELRGHMRGLFGARDNGDHVFFGKWIGGGGEFHGLLAGRYGDGALHGHWLDRELQLKGRVKGIYFEPPILEPRKVGFYLGTWQEACPADPIEPSETEVQ
ncbi:MAG: hypothetical protein HY906_05660 [Deltaproteobacteria bacterium]|nr:hypothetical protein [Deltaproteobacteria bacterium]